MSIFPVSNLSLNNKLLQNCFFLQFCVLSQLHDLDHYLPCTYTSIQKKPKKEHFSEFSKIWLVGHNLIFRQKHKKKVLIKTRVESEAKHKKCKLFFIFFLTKTTFYALNSKKPSFKENECFLEEASTLSKELTQSI